MDMLFSQRVIRLYGGNNMRVLQVTPEAPGMMSGGQRGVLQSLLSLKGSIGTVDYVGPVIKENWIKEKYNNVYELDASGSWIKMIKALLFYRQINKRYYAWKRLNLDMSQYDLVYMDFSKLDYIHKDVRMKNSNIITATRVHNVEVDFSKADYKTSGGLKKYIVNRLSYRQEQSISDESDILLFLTENDRCRFTDLYGCSVDKCKIVPVCIPSQQTVFNKHKNRNEALTILLTGSLGFGFNVNGIIWFLDKVVPLIKCKYSIVIAGSNPIDKLKDKCNKNKNIKLIPSPKHIEPLFEECDMFAIPVFEGGGMKVKFGEAISYGKPIVSTSFGAIGYDVCSGKDCYISDSADGFARAINSFANLNDKEKDELSKRTLNLYKNKYSMESSINQYKDIFLNGIR